MPAYSNLSDEQRIELAIRKGDRMLGPEERRRCATHKRRWETFRWTWPAPKGDETQLDALEGGGEAEPVRQCADCERESE